MEGMEGTFPSANCSITNPDGATTFVKSAPGGFGTSSNSAKIDCYNYATTGEKDYLVIPPMDFTIASSPQLTFNVAYAPYDATYFEQLDVEVSTNCGATWTNVYSKSGATLGTKAAQTTAFTPTAAQWRAETVSLNSYAGQSSVMVQLYSTNGYGNNLYIDDINIAGVVGVQEAGLENTISVFPNPVSSELTIEGSSSSEKIHYTLCNVMGEEIKSGDISSNGTIFNGKVQVGDIAVGMYFIRVNDGIHVFTKKLNKD